MFVDGRTLDGQTLETTICIVGAGAAGITLACHLLDKGIPVVVIESGGLQNEAATQNLYKGEATGLPYSLHETRLRYFGGTTNHWGGYCAPLDEIDFEQRPWVKHSGWPFHRAELDPYYVEAASFMNMGGTGEMAFQPGSTTVPIDDMLTYHLWRKPKNLRFAHVFRTKLETNTDVKIVLHANAVNIVTDADMKSVAKLDMCTLEGQRFSIRARQYVLACGGIENARLLLLPTEHSASGLGNAHDLVGRFFMEHPEIEVGTLYMFGAADALMPLVEEEAWKTLDSVNGKVLNAAPSALAMKRYEILDGALTLRYPKPEPASSSEVLAYMQQLVSSPHLPCFSLSLQVRSEQAPDPNNRVTLSTTRRDALGLPVTQLHLTVSDLEWYSMRKVTELFANAATARQAGLLRLSPWLRQREGWPPPQLEYGCHHMGTTRMDDNPRFGVVDRHGRVHGVANLHIAGSSVFPSVGWANPTYTIIALAIRMADRLKNVLAG